MMKLADWKPEDGGPEISVYRDKLVDLAATLGDEEAFIADGALGAPKTVLVALDAGLAVFNCGGSMSDWQIEGRLVPWSDVRGVRLEVKATRELDRQNPAAASEWELKISDPEFTMSERWAPQRLTEFARICLNRIASP